MRTRVSYALISVDVKSTRNIKNGFTRMGLIIVAVKSLLETRIGLDPLIIVDVKSLLESRIGLDPLMSTKCGCQVYLQHR